MTLLDALTTFLEAASTVSKWRTLAPLEKKLEKQLGLAFAAQGKLFLDKFAANKSKFSEALTPSDWIGMWNAVTGATEQLFLDPIQNAVTASMDAAAEELIADLEVDYTFDLENPLAVEYVEEHGAELVADINSTTRDYLKTVITEGTEQGWSYDRMAKAISDRFVDFAVGRPQDHIDSRAHLVAVTETGMAYEHGNFIVAKDLTKAGLKMEKKWSTMGDSKVDPHCLANEAQGWIPIDKRFSDGSMQPLSHPGCRCTALYRRARP